MKLGNPMSLEIAKELIKKVSQANVESYEATQMECCDEEVCTDFLGVDDYSEVGLNEGDMVVAYTFCMSDNSIAFLIYKGDIVYSVVSMEEDGAINKVEKL